MFDPVLLRTFLVVAETRSFTKAAGRLGVRQPTVSQHIRRLEEAAGRQLFARDTHSVDLTGDGEAMIGFADTILDGMERATAYFAGPQLRGRVRLGASEDIVLGKLPAVLSRFRRSHPLVELGCGRDVRYAAPETARRRTRPDPGQESSRRRARPIRAPRTAGLGGRAGSRRST